MLMLLCPFLLQVPIQRDGRLRADLESLGYSVAVVRDVEQRKQIDVALSAPRESPEGPTGMDHGRVFLFDLQHRMVVRVIDGADGFGNGMDWLGDIDGDRCPDFVAGTLYSGLVAFSGADGRALWASSQGIGASGVVVADFDCDQIRDFVSIEPAPAPGHRLRTWSGATGQAILDREILGRSADAGPVLAGDVDGDGCADLAFLSSLATGQDKLAVSLDVVRVADLTDVARMSVGSAGGSTGWPEFCDGDAMLGVLGDVDQDGSMELLVGLVERDGTLGAARGRLHAIDVRRGRILWTHLCAVSDERMSCEATGGSDVDSDGVPDALVREVVPHLMAVPQLVGRLAVVSGADGHEIREHKGPIFWTSSFPHRAEFIGDIDGDGVDDYVITETCGAFDVAGATEKVRVFSGRSGGELLRFP